MKKGGRQSRNSGHLRALRAEYAERYGGRGTGPLGLERRSLYEEASPPIGWPIWFAWFFGLLGFFPAIIAWMFMGLAMLTPLTINQAILIGVLLAPVLGGAFSLLGLVFALGATRRARRIQAGVAAPVTLVWLATAILVGGLLFGGLVAYPRVLLGTFGQAIQAHCARVAQSLQSYGNPPDVGKLEQDPLGVVAILQRDQAALEGDQAALSALAAPVPKYQMLLDDCRSLAVKDVAVTDDLLSELAKRPPDLAAVQERITQYEKDTHAMLTEIQRLGDELRRQVFAPFQPG